MQLNFNEYFSFFLIKTARQREEDNNGGSEKRHRGVDRGESEIEVRIRARESARRRRRLMERGGYGPGRRDIGWREGEERIRIFGGIRTDRAARRGGTLRGPV